ncbi:hypothetical protein Dimus_001965, partial [Dionaea muscipula]
EEGELSHQIVKPLKELCEVNREGAPPITSSSSDSYFKGPDMLSFSPTTPFPSCLSDLTPYQNENVPKEDIMEEASSNDDDFWTCPVYSRYEKFDMDKSTIE